MTELREPPPPPAPLPAGWEGILEPGEVILWQGRPDARIGIAPRHLPEIGFGLVFTGFALFWMVSAYSMGAGLLFTAFGLPFVAVGLSVMLRSTLSLSRRLRRTWYTLTSRRAIIATDPPFQGRSLQSYPITAASLLGLDQQAGLYTLSFARADLADGSGSRRRQPIGFERIADGPKVLALMRQIQGEAR